MDSFPKASRKVVQPTHVGHGECLDIKCDGITSLNQSELGSEMNFLDMNQAYRNGMFGTEAKIWGDDEWALLLDYLCGGITHSKEEWENLEYRVQVWDTEDQRVTKPTKARNSHLRGLAARAAKPDAYLKHQMSIKAFSADDVLSTITESTACNSEGEASEGTCASASKEIWGQVVGARTQARQEQSARHGGDRQRQRSRQSQASRTRHQALLRRIFIIGGTSLGYT